MRRVVTLFIFGLALNTACDKRSSSRAVVDGGVPVVAAPSASSPPPTGVSTVVLKRLRELNSSGAVAFVEYTFSTALAAGSVWVARVDLTKSKLSLIQADEPRPLLEVVQGNLPKGNHVAINGSFYGRDGRPMGWVVREGKQLAPKTRAGGSGILLVHDGAARIVHREATMPATLPDLALQSIDRLVDAGKSVVRFRPGMRRDARSVVAVRADGAVLFVAAFDAQAADPRGPGVIALNEKSTTTGLTLAELAGLLAAPRDRGGLGVKTALNLDGGFSTGMQVQVSTDKMQLLPHRKTTNALVARTR